jgi:hypothetical protein
MSHSTTGTGTHGVSSLNIKTAMREGGRRTLPQPAPVLIFNDDIYNALSIFFLYAVDLLHC